jgi:hypothetical protein
MAMRRLIAILAVALLPLAGWSSGPPPAPQPQTVTISSKGLDVRSVLHDLFTQTNHNYVLEPNVRFVLYLSVKDIDFEEGLQIVCKLANLDYQLQNGIYYVGPKHASQPPKTEPKPDPIPDQKPPIIPKPSAMGTLPRGALQRTVTTKHPRIEFTALAADLTRQTGVPIELEPAIAKWKLDAFFNGSSLRYVLDRICSAGHLTYRLTDHLTVEIQRREAKTEAEPDHVTVFRD